MFPRKSKGKSVPAPESPAPVVVDTSPVVAAGIAGFPSPVESARSATSESARKGIPGAPKIYSTTFPNVVVAAGRDLTVGELIELSAPVVRSYGPEGVAYVESGALGARARKFLGELALRAKGKGPKGTNLAFPVPGRTGGIVYGANRGGFATFRYDPTVGAVVVAPELLGASPVVAPVVAPVPAPESAPKGTPKGKGKKK